MSFPEPKNCRIDPVQHLSNRDVTVDVLRLDLLHPVISGNKWFKLKPYLQAAVAEGKKEIVTFGGAYSNHIVAAAAAARASGLRSTGIIRGERPAKLSPTLEDAQAYGMELHFVSREDYRDRRLPDLLLETPGRQDFFLIEEGGYGTLGAAGAADILKAAGLESYDRIIAAAGTGTMLAGLIMAAQPHQRVTGISVLKNHGSLEAAVGALLPAAKRFELLHDYHFGGYAKGTPALYRFMNEWYGATGISSDFVYTGKLFFAVQDLVRQGHFPPAYRILVIHSGGLQGNRSLPKGTLIF